MKNIKVVEDNIVIVFTVKEMLDLAANYGIPCTYKEAAQLLWNCFFGHNKDEDFEGQLECVLRDHFKYECDVDFGQHVGGKHAKHYPEEILDNLRDGVLRWRGYTQAKDENAKGYQLIEGKYVKHNGLKPEFFECTSEEETRKYLEKEIEERERKKNNPWEEEENFPDD